MINNFPINFQKRKRKKDHDKTKSKKKRNKNETSSEEETDELGSTGTWKVMCYTEEDWRNLADSLAGMSITSEFVFLPSVNPSTKKKVLISVEFEKVGVRNVCVCVCVTSQKWKISLEKFHI